MSIKTFGMFILTGSHQLALHEAITQSLARNGYFKFTAADHC